MESKLIVQFDCTERLERSIQGLLSFAQHLATFNQGTILSTEKEETVHDSEEVLNEPVPAEKVEEPAEAEAKKPTKPTTEEENHTEISDADLRTAMKACRSRILGDKGDAILRKCINDKLKEKVHELGFSVSTDLPQNLRVEFIKFCETININTSEEVPY